MILAPTLLLNAGSGAAIARPTFSRDFAGERTLNNGTGPAITFTRASNATFFDASGVLQTASNDTPRFDHDPATGASRGLLIEEARTNLLERSAEFDNAYWTKIRTSVTANTTTAPDGTTTADTLVEDTSTNTHNLYRPVTHAAATGTVTLSVFAKQKERLRIQFDLIAIVGSDSTGVRCTFNLSTGSAGSVFGTQTGIGSAGTGTAAITNVGNGWYRCSLTLVPAAGITPTSNQIYVSPDNGTTANYTGDGTSGILIWGAQLEAGAFATSYIPTTSAAATRAADSAVVTPISSFYNQSEGTLFAEASTLRVPPSASSKILNFNRGQFSARIDIHYVNGFIAAEIEESGLSFQFNGGTALANTVYKTTLGYAANNAAASVNGSAATTDTSVTLMTNATQMNIGRNVTFDMFLNGHIRKIAYWPRRLSNTLLQQLTT